MHQIRWTYCIPTDGLDGREGGVWLETVATAKSTASKRRIIDTSAGANWFVRDHTN
jgi:hypothetical protein